MYWDVLTAGQIMVYWTIVIKVFILLLIFYIFVLGILIVLVILNVMNLFNNIIYF